MPKDKSERPPARSAGDSLISAGFGDFVTRLSNLGGMVEFENLKAFLSPATNNLDDKGPNAKLWTKWMNKKESWIRSIFSGRRKPKTP
jgi:hypothetical protein